MSLSFPFQRGQWVVLVLREPRERLWGRLLGLEQAGIALRGLDVNPWEEILPLVAAGHADQVSVGTRFLPMHRVESLYLDEPACGLPSLGEIFRERTGQAPETLVVLDDEGC